MNHDQYRQGDVLLMRIASMPSGAKPDMNSEDRIVLAYGEVTGHAHCLSPNAATLYVSNNERYLEVRQPTDLVHEEHAALKIEPGIFKVVRQREYSPQEVRLVCD